MDFPDSTCNDGTATGIGVNLRGGKDLLLFLNGGGACWDPVTCYALPTAAQGPFGAAQFQATRFDGTLLDRRLPDNPFADFDLVYVPYCTGDVHAGDRSTSYVVAGKERPYHHRGRRNLEAFLRRVAATVPRPGRAVISGSSAGGFGAAFSYDLFRRYFPESRVYLLDDSGPPLIGDAIDRSLREAWYKAWQLDQTVAPLCPGCRDDFTRWIPALLSRYPGDRYALLSSLQDGVIRGFFLLSAPEFEGSLLEMAHKVLDPHPSFRYYFVAGSKHTMLYAPPAPLLGWLRQFIGDDPAWASVKP